jgi:preprotein translocase subunit SecG
MSGFLIALITMLHIGVCIGLMASILLQSGKGGGLAGTFGAGSSQTLFGGRGAATFLSRATTVLAVTFFLTSLTLGINAARSSGLKRSLIQEEARRRGGQRQTEIPGGGSTTSPGPAATQPGAGATQGPVPAGPMPGAVTQTPSPMPQPTATPKPATNGTQAPTGNGTSTGGK